jgi:gliding-associated putative ABC transporter substrate-binding component GldG
MNRKDLKKDTIIKVAVIIGIIILVNVISNRVFTRADLTEKNIYTLSPISKDIVSSLDDKMLVKAYFTESLPPPYNSIRRQVQDILDDYRTYSNGNLQYEFINPVPTGEGETTKLDQEAQNYGIQQVQIQVVEEDKLEVKRAYLGLVFLYEGRQEVIPVVQNTNNLEYEITSTIKKLTTETKRKVGFLEGNGEIELSKLQQINQVLSVQYDLVPVDIKGNTPVADDIDVLIIMGPKGEYTESQKFMIDQFIMRGGNAAFLINKVAPDFTQQIVMGQVIPTNLDDMLESYGIKINTDLIRDIQNAPVQVQSPIGIPVSVNYPFFPMITNIARDNPAFKNIQSVVLTFASSLDTGIAEGKDVHIDPLLVTSDRSGKVQDFFILNLEQFQRMTQAHADTMFNDPGYLVGATYSGRFKSFYDGKGIQNDTAGGAAPYTGTVINESQKVNKLVVIGDGDFANEENRPPRDNILFFINLVDYLMDDVGLAEIRTKDTSEAPIEETSEGTKKFVRYFNLIFPPALVLLFGLYEWKQRKSKKKTLQKD